MDSSKYQNGKIYMVIDNDRTKCYIGSTCAQCLSKRMGRHREQYKRYKDGKATNKYSIFHLFDEFGVGNCVIELIEAYPCQTQKELVRKEGEYIKKSIGCINKNVAGRTVKEWGEDNKEPIRARKQIYYRENKQNIQEYKKSNEEHIKEYAKQYNKQYREKNGEKIKLQKQDYYESNKTIINEKIRCECGVLLNKRDMSRHEQTKKHTEYLDFKGQPESQKLKTMCPCGTLYLTRKKKRHERSKTHQEYISSLDTN